MTRIGITALALVALTAAAPAVETHHRLTNRRLLHRWAVLNERCRGGAGDDQTTQQACDERTLFEDALFARGY
jgi:hypothetical protein